MSKLRAEIAVLRLFWACAPQRCTPVEAFEVFVHTYGGKQHHILKPLGLIREMRGNPKLRLEIEQRKAKLLAGE